MFIKAFKSRSEICQKVNTESATNLHCIIDYEFLIQCWSRIVRMIRLILIP